MLAVRAGDATLAVIADEDASSLRVVDVDRLDELGTFALPGRPAQLLMLTDRRLAVTLRDRDELAIVSGSGLADAPFAIDQQIDLASEPIGLALTPDDRTLLVTSGWGHTLTSLRVGSSLAIVRTWDLAPEPRAVVATDDNRFAYVSHAVGQQLERIDLDNTQRPTAIALSGEEEISERHQIEVGERPRVTCQGFALARSIAPAGRIYAPGVQVLPSDTRQPSSGYGGSDGMPPEVFDVAVVDEDRGEAIPESLALRFVPRGAPCVLPRAAVASTTGSLFVSCVGANTILELGGAEVTPANAEVRHWDVPAGPTGIALDEANERAVVWSQLAHTITRLGTRGPTAIYTAVLDSAIPATIARGRELFVAVADPRISNDGRACESCHPDGRQDTLVWSTPLGPRQAPMLAGRLANTAPYGWNGSARDLQHHLMLTFSRLHGTGLHDADRDALIAYLSAMPAPHSAAPVDAGLVADGETIFRSANAECASCHGDDGRSPDGLRHNVDSWIEGDARAEFDTPSLAFVAGTPPYYHDGRFATLRELLVKSRGHMGQKHRFDAHELDALEAYLRTR